ncbi:Membrane proteins related to metalloendopeptidases [Microbacterium esteraromaticum]|uniref:Membrane proteins related to metalloendopeptidases n=1 Tax=Microbacterium esteraromaticum TaxID=57043 RepID=A0A1R4I6N4_9MICO|nr:M23 family metallopeptidase [Microbacterium esteraromaticum]SJN15274.1 Membrane proteins related to metalloendopeptidases [Microbacterium esteraromaticum]
MAAEIVTTDTVADIKKSTRRRATTRSRSSVKPMRTVAIFAAVGALVAAVALPAYAGTKAPAAQAAATLQQMAVDDAQSLVVASQATTTPMERGSYSATTPEEIAKKKAEEAAKARAAAAAAAARVASSGGGSVISDADLRLISAGSGEVRSPLPGGSYYVSRTLGNGHNGADMVAPAGTPIFAATSGVVRISSESYYGYGVAIVIDSVVGGQRVSTTYAHMIHGTRAVSAGQTVQAGQFIGKVGNTGRSYGAHLHFEVQINGSLVEPIGWLRANAG